MASQLMQKAETHEGLMEKKMETAIVHWDHMGKIEKKMELYFLTSSTVSFLHVGMTPPTSEDITAQHSQLNKKNPRASTALLRHCFGIVFRHCFGIVYSLGFEISHLDPALGAFTGLMTK